jgi:hypothetical protein
MSQNNLADLASAVQHAESRLRAMTPRTTAWLDAQRHAVQARADYWDARCQEWDLDHPKPKPSSRPLGIT